MTESIDWRDYGHTERNHTPTTTRKRRRRKKQSNKNQVKKRKKKERVLDDKSVELRVGFARMCAWHKTRWMGPGICKPKLIDTRSATLSTDGGTRAVPWYQSPGHSSSSFFFFLLLLPLQQRGEPKNSRSTSSFFSSSS